MKTNPLSSLLRWAFGTGKAPEAPRRRPSLEPLEGREVLSAFHVVGPSPVLLTPTPLHAGKTLSLRVQMVSHDAGERYENEPLVFESGGRVVAGVQPDGAGHVVTLKADHEGQTFNARIVGGDYDEWADLATGGMVIPTQLSLNADNTVTLASTTTQPAAGVPISVYWQAGGLSKPLFTLAADGHAGPHTVTVPAAAPARRPPDATGLAVVADPRNSLHQANTDGQRLTLPGDLTARQLREAMPSLSPALAAAYTPLLNAAMREFNITTLEQRAMFLGQIAHESEDLTRWDEVGNHDPYHGRGPIQLTGLANYRAVGVYFHVDLVKSPGLVVSNPRLGFRAAAWFWSKNGHLNSVADRNAGALPLAFTTAATRVIDPGEVAGHDRKHIADRRSRYERARSVLLAALP